ncbi:hypothetical protein TNIN_456781 [Trichonephila inaurata madagascariensis]|uniref:Uncharacterized protein n=1 Tax=Trichonephila inaurata madagascariensis TaxID=2747483 RepID=A0A8X6YVL9_9ARAC|nr:hypothetical protein TNIN_456781 [Trichonephila inaurata madagascariensis]
MMLSLTMSQSTHLQWIQLLTDCEDNAKMIEAKSKYFKELISIVEKPNADLETKQGLQTEMKKIEESKKIVLGELTGLTPCPIKDCLHNATVKSLRRKLASGSLLRPATLNLDKNKLKINEENNFKIPSKKAKGNHVPPTPTPVLTANKFGALNTQKVTVNSGAEAPKPKIDPFLMRFSENYNLILQDLSPNC